MMNSAPAGSRPSSSRRGSSRRDSSTASSKRRPPLFRASATESSIKPSITASVVSHGVLSNPQSARRAADLLNHVAFVSGSPPVRTQSPIYDRMARIDRERERARSDPFGSSPTSQNESIIDELRPYPCRFSSCTTDEVYQSLAGRTDSGRYFSFPSFDTWDPDRQEKEEDEEAKSL